MKRIIILNAIVFLLFFCGCNSSKKEKNNETSGKAAIYAAAGTRFVTEEICNEFENGKYKVERNYASSGTLARQIANGAECDVFVSANKQWIDYLLEKNLLIENSIKKVAGNSLVVIAPKESNTDSLKFDTNFDIESFVPNNIAIGDPAFVPVGKYTKTVFDSLGWTNLIDGKTIKAKDVTSVLHLVELGECDWGVVYKSEAIKSLAVKIINRIPQSLHQPIYFYVADIIGQSDTGKKLSKAFCSEEGRKIFEENGFCAIYNGEL